MAIRDMRVEIIPIPAICLQSALRIHARAARQKSQTAESIILHKFILPLRATKVCLLWDRVQGDFELLIQSNFIRHAKSGLRRALFAQTLSAAECLHANKSPLIIMQSVGRQCFFSSGSHLFYGNWVES